VGCLHVWIGNTSSLTNSYINTVTSRKQSADISVLITSAQLFSDANQLDGEQLLSLYRHPLFAFPYFSKGQAVENQFTFRIIPITSATCSMSELILLTGL